MKFKINGLIENPNYEKLKCTCSKVQDDILNKHPLKKCLSCYCNIALNSMPRESFKVNVPILDRHGKPTNKTEIKIINEITIDRTEDGLQMVRGWTFG
jgi:hypothetical protein|tara:strand:+ start:188 stop:481 length:294 start_codon:yes stop_codon:yes gene_type:complete